MYGRQACKNIHNYIYITIKIAYKPHKKEGKIMRHCYASSATAQADATALNIAC